MRERQLTFIFASIYQLADCQPYKNYLVDYRIKLSVGGRGCTPLITPSLQLQLITFPALLLPQSPSKLICFPE